MADIAINPVTRRVQFTGNTGLGPFAFTFNILADADIAVYKNTTLLTLTTDYTVSTNVNGTGSITLTGSGNGTALIASDVLTIIGGRNLERTTDFVTAGDLLASSLNEQLDSLVIMAQQLDEKMTRSFKVNPGDVFTDLEMPLLDDRKGKYLAFNSTTGDPEAGPDETDVTALAAITSDIATLADIEDGTDATDAIQTVAGISSNVTTVAGISSNVTTVAGISSDVTAVASDATDIGTVATNIASVNTNATNIASINTNATNITDIQNASTNAATATTKAAEAATSASNAATSETNAATSATNAATSASAAAASQTAAAASAASAASSYDSFDDRYLGVKSSDPTVDNDGNALVAGALYFSSTSNTMQVYDGASWIAATSAGNVSLLLYEYTATSGQTTFSGADDNAATLSYTVNNIQVVMNGVILDPSDYTATSGTSVVLASGAATGDTVNIYAFKSFTVADTVSASAGGTFAGNVAVTGDLTVDTNTLYVDSTNNRVGVKTVSPNATLDVSDSTVSTIRSTSGSYNLTGYQYANGFAYLLTNGQLEIGTSGANILALKTNNTERLRIESSGNIGIGTSSIDNKVNIQESALAGRSASNSNTSLTLEHATDTGIQFFSATQTQLRFGDAASTGAGSIIYTHSDDALKFSANGSERMRIDSNGDLLVGTTGSLIAGARVRASATAATFEGEVTDAGGSGAVLWANRTASDGWVAAWYRGGSSVGSISVTGSSTAYNTSSDHRLKEDVQPMTGASDRVLALNPVNFAWKVDGSRVDGFLAHEAQAVVPEAVTGTHNEVDDDGNAVMQGIDQSKLVPLLTAALKESIAKIEALEARVTALEGNT